MFHPVELSLILLGNGEDQPPGVGLQHFGHLHKHLLIEEFATVFNHDHRPVFQVANPLADFFPFLDNFQGIPSPGK
ncbi:MAG: hypothetical protein IPK16_24145 [Anaerolineales bacterium]|nr:hypothetical protein [Anaerolineales bacterium]